MLIIPILVNLAHQTVLLVNQILTAFPVLSDFILEEVLAVPAQIIVWPVMVLRPVYIVLKVPTFLVVETVCHVQVNVPVVTVHNV